MFSVVNVVPKIICGVSTPKIFRAIYTAKYETEHKLPIFIAFFASALIAIKNTSIPNTVRTYNVFQLIIMLFSANVDNASQNRTDGV